MKKIAVYYRSSHHATNSGYDKLLDYLDIIKVPKTSDSWNIPYNVAKGFSKLFNKDKGEYNSDSVRKEIEIYKILKQLKNQAKVVHYLNAERDIRLLVKNKAYFPNTFFCATFHKPNDILIKQIPNNVILKMSSS